MNGGDLGLPTTLIVELYCSLNEGGKVVRFRRAGVRYFGINL